MSKPQSTLSTRERLIEAGSTLFWEKGYANTSMADLLGRAKVNSGSFYHFFKGKEDLLLAVLDRYMEILPSALLEPAWKEVDDPLERIFSLLALYRESILKTECTYGCPIGRLALEISPTQREVHQRLTSNFDSWARAIQDCVESAGDRLPHNIGPERLSKFVLAVMEGGVMLSRSSGSVEPFDAVVSELHSYFSRLQHEVEMPNEPSKRARPRTQKTKNRSK